MKKKPLSLIMLPFLLLLPACEEAPSSSISIDPTLCDLREVALQQKSFVEKTEKYTSIYQVSLDVDENGEKSHYFGWQHYTTTCMDYGDTQDYTFVMDRYLYYGHAEEGNSFYLRSRKEHDEHYAIYFNYFASFSDFTDDAICHLEYRYEERYSPEPYAELSFLSFSVSEGNKELKVEARATNRQLTSYSSILSYIEDSSIQKRTAVTMSFTYEDEPSKMPDISDWTDLTPSSSSAS